MNKCDALVSMFTYAECYLENRIKTVTKIEVASKYETELKMMTLLFGDLLDKVIKEEIR